MTDKILTELDQIERDLKRIRKELGIGRPTPTDVYGSWFKFFGIQVLFLIVLVILTYWK